MKNKIKILALVSLLMACSDFFPDRGDHSGTGKQTDRGGSSPEKVTIDEKACEYGELASADTTRQFLWNLATKNICPRVREFRYHLAQLRTATDQLCVDPDNYRIERDVLNSWYNTVSTFEYLIANPMEPLRANNGRLGMEIYSWPNHNKYSLNAELLKAAEQGEAYSMQLASSRKGLVAVEKLIFNKQAILPPGSSGRLRPEEEAFNALPKDKRQQARCIVLRHMLNDAAVQAEALYSEWDAHQKQYPREMLRRLDSGAQSMVLNEISDGLFYLEKVKDFKLGQPLGLNARCRLDRCPEDIEMVISGASTEALRQNFEAFRAGMIGVGGPGFLSLVRDVGRGDLADSMTAQIEQIDATLKEVEQLGDFKQQVLNMDKAQCQNAESSVPVCRLYFQWKNFSATYRSDFMTALNLNPPRTDADND